MSPPEIKAKTFFGLRTDIRGNAHFMSDTVIVYPVGGVLVLHDYVGKNQKFISISTSQKTILSISIAPNKQILALSEKSIEKDKKPTVGIYDLQNLKLIKDLTIPYEDVSSTEFIAIDFSCDSKYLVGITGEPDWMLYYYNWDSGKIESSAKAQNPNGTGKIAQVNCNPTDPTLLVVTGPGTFRLMNVLESIWRQWGWNKAENFVITSCMWLTPDRVLFGTNKGILMTVENGEMKENWSYNGIDIMEIYMKKTEEKADSDMTAIHERFLELHSQGNESNEIRCLSAFPKGFAYSCGSGMVHMFEKESRYKWAKRNVFKVTDEPFRDDDKFIDLNAIQYISINPNQDTLLATTLKSQLYFVRLFEQNMNQEPEIPFKELGQRLHHKCINGLTMCSWKPIFMTSGKDDWSVRIWNYESEELELVKFYNGEINCISLHPTGLFALIGFSDKLRYMVITIDDLQQIREFDIKNCRVCNYSNNGHMFAAVSSLTIKVYSTISFLNLFDLKGHTDTIRAISWAGSDDKLFSCGSDGGIYEWCTITGNRISDIVLKDSDFTDCAATSDGKSVYVVGTDTEVKEVNKNEIIRNLKIIGLKLDNIVLARSDYMLFVSGGDGNVVSIQFPLLDKAIFSEFRMHNRNVTAMTLSYDDMTLITVAEDATMCIWRLQNPEGKAITMDDNYSYSQDILINKTDLKKNKNDIMLLSKRISEMKVEHQFVMRKINNENTNKLEKVNNEYSKMIAELKKKIEYLEANHTYEVNVMKNNYEKMEFEHEKKLEIIESDFNAKRIYEYEKYNDLESKVNAIKQEYETKIHNLETLRTCDIQELKNAHEIVVLEKNQKITELVEQNQLQLNQHEYIKNAIEEDADREILELKMQYEKQLKTEKDVNIKHHGELEVLNKKLSNAKKTIETNNINISGLQSEHKQYQSRIDGLETNIKYLKSEIKGRDQKIRDRERNISDLNMKIQELEKYKFVLNWKIEALEKEAKSKTEEITRLESEIEEIKKKHT